jgi:hypothetical protein
MNSIIKPKYNMNALLAAACLVGILKVALARLGRAASLPSDCPIYPENIAFNISREFFIQKVNVSIALSQLFNKREIGEMGDNFASFDVFQDYNDHALVVKTFDGICFGAFSATNGGADSFLAYALSKLVLC